MLDFLSTSSRRKKQHRRRPTISGALLIEVTIEAERLVHPALPTPASARPARHIPTLPARPAAPVILSPRSTSLAHMRPMYPPCIPPRTDSCGLRQPERESVDPPRFPVDYAFSPSHDLPTVSSAARPPASPTTRCTPTFGIESATATRKRSGIIFDHCLSSAQPSPRSLYSTLSAPLHPDGPAQSEAVPDLCYLRPEARSPRLRRYASESTLVEPDQRQLALSKLCSRSAPSSLCPPSPIAYPVPPRRVPVRRDEAQFDLRTFGEARIAKHLSTSTFGPGLPPLDIFA